MGSFRKTSAKIDKFSPTSTRSTCKSRTRTMGSDLSCFRLFLKLIGVFYSEIIYFLKFPIRILGLYKYDLLLKSFKFQKRRLDKFEKLSG